MTLLLERSSSTTTRRPDLRRARRCGVGAPGRRDRPLSPRGFADWRRRGGQGVHRRRSGHSKRRAAFEERRGAVFWAGAARASEFLAAVPTESSRPTMATCRRHLRRAPRASRRRGPVRRRRGAGAGRAEAPNSVRRCRSDDLPRPGAAAGSPRLRAHRGLRLRRRRERRRRAGGDVGLRQPSRLPAVGAIVSSNSDARPGARWGHALHGAIHRSTSQHLAGTRVHGRGGAPATALEVLAPRRRATRGMEAVAALRGPCSISHSTAPTVRVRRRAWRSQTRAASAAERT